MHFSIAFSYRFGEGLGRVLRWVREGFADALGKTVPNELEKATEKGAQEHLKRLRFPDGGSASV